MTTEPEYGLLASRSLPDARMLGVEPLTYGAARLCIGPENGQWWEDFWDYGTAAEALVAFRKWDPAQAAEPSGWVRHAPSGRRRLRGDPANEEVRP